MKYLIGVFYIMIAILMWSHLDIFNDTQDIFGGIFFALGSIYITFNREI